MTGTARRDELEANLTSVRAQIRAAAVDAGRDPAEVSLIVVTKTFPSQDIAILFELGVRDFGENRHLEAAEKAAELADLPITWHFIGQAQANKAAKIAAYADVVHSVDSVRLARRLGMGAVEYGRSVRCLIQVSLDGPDRATGRGGVDLRDTDVVAKAVEETDGLLLAGVMALAPLGEPPEDAFGQAARAWHAVLAGHRGATMFSAGMSGDFPAAIRAGATHVRVGSAVVGARHSLG